MAQQRSAVLIRGVRPAGHRLEIPHRHAVRYEKRGKAYYYSPAIDESAYKAQETGRFVEKLHGGSVRSMIAALCDSRELTPEDVEKLRRMFDLDR